MSAGSLPGAGSGARAAQGRLMSQHRLHALAFLILAALTLVLVRYWTPTRHLADQRAKVDLEQMFPQTFGDWRMDTSIPVQLVSPDMQQLLSTIYNQTLSRNYINSQRQRIMLSVAYGGDQTDATRAHRPEVCYPAQGFQILSSQVGRVDTGAKSLPVRRLVAKAGARTEPISYWVVVGDHTALSGTEQKLAQLRYSSRGVIADGMLVRVSNIDTNTAASFDLHAQFIAQLSAAMPAPVRDRIMGTAGD